MILRASIAWAVTGGLLVASSAMAETPREKARNAARDLWVAGKYLPAYRAAYAAYKTFGLDNETQYILATSACRIPEYRTAGYRLLLDLVRRNGQPDGPTRVQLVAVAHEVALCEPTFTTATTTTYAGRPARLWVGMSGAPWTGPGTSPPPLPAEDQDAVDHAAGAQVANASDTQASLLQMVEALPAAATDPFPSGLDWPWEAYR